MFRIVVTGAYPAQVQVPAATPVASPGAGTYSGTQSVTLTCSTNGSSIYYTTNGSTPTPSSTLYTGPISIAATETLQAIATAPLNLPSAVFSGTYTISGGGSAPTAPTALVMSLQALQTANAGGVVVDPQAYTSPFNPPPYINNTQISWVQGTGGVGGISFNKIYRSTTSNSAGFSLLHTSSTPITTYMDTTANNSIYYGNSDSNYTGTTYWYKVSAVDTAANESAQSAAQNFVQYQNGVNNWGPGFDSGVTSNYQSTTQVYPGHANSRQVVITASQSGGDFAFLLPFADCTVATWNQWNGAFNNFQFDVWVPNAGADALIYFVRVNDVGMYNSSGQQIELHLNAFVTTVANQWNHVSIPLVDLINDYGVGGAGPPIMRYACYKYGYAPQGVATGYTFYFDNMMFTQ